MVAAATATTSAPDEAAHDESQETWRPEEGWGYFLTQDPGAVRWSDVGFTGYQHGANPVAIFAHELFVYRAVSQSGPFDNSCGLGKAMRDFDPNNLPYDPNCAPAHIASWLDSLSVTLVRRPRRHRPTKRHPSADRSLAA
jgi:hypothetical protein